MFTVDQIIAVHSKVKSGADFPAYIRDLKKLGVTYYEIFVADGHAVYYGENEFKTSSLPKYSPLAISETTDTTNFISKLKSHQSGMTDFLTFFKDAASSGVEKWAVCMDKMTCTYHDKAGNKMLVENIPH